jgi:hypothetical protein
MGFDQNRDSTSIRANLDDLIQLTREKEQLCRDKQWKVTVGEREISVREYAARISKLLEQLGDIVIPFAPREAGPPWGVVKAVLRVRKSLLSRIAPRLTPNSSLGQYNIRY